MKMSESSRVCDKKLTVNNSLHEAAGSRPVTWTSETIASIVSIAHTINFGVVPDSRGVVFSPPYRDIVQLAERLSGGQEAAGSNPAISTIRHTQQIYSTKNIIGSSPIPALIIG